MKCVIWNTEWAIPHNPRGQLLQELIYGRAPDVICLTEAKAALHSLECCACFRRT